MAPSDPRTLPARLHRWLASRGYQPSRIEPLTGDISLRRYFRAALGDGTTAVVAYYPVALRAVCRRFRLTTALLAGAGVPVPAILAVDCRRGLMLLADSGERTLYEEGPRPWTELLPSYREAVCYLRRIQALPHASVAPLNPALDEALLRWELDKSWDLFLGPTGLVGPPRGAGRLREALAALCRRLGDPATAVPCHRDFMPRNLMRRPAGGLLVLDHQDLRLGPPAYDLASLLNDSLFPPPEVERELLDELLPGAEGELAYRRAVVQRTLKAIGNYCDFARRGFDRHIGLVRPSLARAWRSMATLPELAPLLPELRERWERYLGEAPAAATDLLS